MESDPSTRERLDRLERKIDAVYRSSERMRRYFLWTLIVSVAVVVLPLIALAFVIPWFLETITGTLMI